MGDRAWVGITFYEVPDEHRKAVFEFLDDNLLLRDGVLILGEQYECEEMNLGWCSDEVSMLVEQAPGIVVDAAQGNRYEFNGERLIYAPHLGTFLAEEDGQGSLIMAPDTIEKVYDGLPNDATAEQFKRALDLAAGTPWFEYIGECEQRLKDDSMDCVITAPDEEGEVEA